MRLARLSHLEVLEDRCLPATFGIPWPNAERITVSFVADGTPLGPSWSDTQGQLHQAESSLFATLDRAMPTATWQGEILRALQTWAAEAKINLVTVSDSGDAMGSTGLPQGDPRFGDIRIFGQQLSSSALAISLPPDPRDGTWVGDIIFNTKYLFSSSTDQPGYDLFTVALQESGHVLGIGNSANPNSVMYEAYHGPKLGLDQSDITSIRNLYGRRSPDDFEKGIGNNTYWTATSLSSAAEKTAQQVPGDRGEVVPGASNDLVVLAELTAGDVDIYRFPAPATGKFSVQLQTVDQSLLQAKVTVVHSSGQVMGSALAGDSGSDGVLEIDAANRGGNYYLRVEKANAGVFSVGRYRLVVTPTSSHPRGNSGTNGQTDEAAIRLDKLNARQFQQWLGGNGRIGSARDVDYYSFRWDGISGRELILSSKGFVQIRILDSRGDVLLENSGDGVSTLALNGLSAGKLYYLEIRGVAGAAYGFMVNNPLAQPLAATVVSGVLTAAQPVQQRGLLVPQTSAMQLDVILEASSSNAGTAVAVELLDYTGNQVYRQVTQPGKTLSLKILLPAGAYTVQLIGATADHSPLPDITFRIGSEVLSDPIGPELVDPNDPANLLVTWYDLGFVEPLVLVDPYGTPLDPITTESLVTITPDPLPPPDTTTPEEPAPEPLPPPEGTTETTMTDPLLVDPVLTLA